MVLSKAQKAFKKSLAKARSKKFTGKGTKKDPFKKIPAGFQKKTSSQTFGEAFGKPKTTGKPDKPKPIATKKPVSKSKVVSKQEVAKAISQPTVTSVEVNTKTGLTKKTAEVSQSQVIRAGKVKSLKEDIFTLAERVRKSSEKKPKTKIKFGGLPSLPFITTKISDGVIKEKEFSIKSLKSAGSNLKSAILGKNQPVFDLEKEAPKTSRFLQTAAFGAGAVLVTRKLPATVTGGTLFRTGERALTTSFIGEKVIGFQSAKSKKEFFLETGLELVAFAAGGVGAAKGPKLFASAKRTASVKFEQVKLNIQLKTSGGKVVTKDFFKRADIGKATITGEALISAKGRVQRVESPFGVTERISFKPKTEKVKITFDARKPPIPNDFLFRGSVKDTTIVQPFSSSKPGVSSRRLLFEKKSEVGGFGFPKSLDKASTPFTSIRVDPGIARPFSVVRSREVNLVFGATKLSRSRSLAKIDPFARKTRTAKPQSKRIGVTKKELQFSSFPKQDGTLLLTKRGRLFAPKGIELTEGQGKVGGFFKLRTIKRPGSSKLSQPILRGGKFQVPIIAKKVKLTAAPTKKTKVKKGFLEAEIPIRTATGQVLIQKVLLREPKLKQQTKQKQKQKTTTVSKQKFKQALGTQQKTKQKVKLATKTKLGTRQAQKQSVRLGLVQTVKQAQRQATRQTTGQRISQIPRLDIAQLPKIDQIISQKPKISQLPRQAVDTKLRTPQILELAPPSKPGKFGRPGRPPKRPFKFPKFELPGLSEKKRTRRTTRVKLKSQFTPSLVALDLGITGKRKKLEKETFTGLGIRPIPL